MTANNAGNSVSILRNLAPPTTAVSVVTLSAEATASRVRIEWYAPGDRILLTSVFRRTTESDWALQGHPEPDASRQNHLRRRHRVTRREATAIDSWCGM